jgi:polygalacturonase
MLKLVGSFVLLASVAEVIASPAPSTTLEKRATCTFSGSNGAASAMASQKACSTIVLNNVAVPAGTTLDLSNLADGTTVCPHFCHQPKSI